MALTIPTAGELRHRVRIRLWADVPNTAFGLDRTEGAGIERWAKVEAIGAALYWGAEQVQESITHRVWVRLAAGTRPQDITGSHVIEWQGMRYRVMRTLDVNGEGRFTLVEVKQLGPLT